MEDQVQDIQVDKDGFPVPKQHLQLDADGFPVPVKKKEPPVPGGNPLPPNSPSTFTSSLGQGANVSSGKVFQGMGAQPAAAPVEEVAVTEEATAPAFNQHYPRSLAKKSKSFLDNDIDVSLNFSLKNPALNKTKDKLALGAPPNPQNNPSLNIPFDQQVAIQKRQIVSDPSLLKEYGRTRMQQIGEMAANFNSASEDASKQFVDDKMVFGSNENAVALKNKAAELENYQKEFKQSLKEQAAISVTGKAIKLGQKPDPIQIGREVLDVISDPSIKEDEKVLAELKNPSEQYFLNPHGEAEVSVNKYDLTAADKSQQNINYTLYRTGADAMSLYYDDVRNELYNQAPDRINTLVSLVDAKNKLSPSEQTNAANPVNIQLEALRKEPVVSDFITTNLDYAKSKETSENAIKQFPQVERLEKIRSLNEAWFNLSNAKASGGTYGSELPRIWRLMFGDKPSEEDIPSIAKVAGISKKEAEDLINEGGTGMFHVLAPNVRTSGLFPGMARGAGETLDNVAMGMRRAFDPTSAATETRNRLQKDQMIERGIIAQGNMLKDDSGKWNINPMSIANVFGYGMGQTSMIAIPALISGGVAAEGSILSKGLELVNTVIPGAAATYEDSWKTAKANGASDATAKAYAFWASMAAGGAEALYSPADVIKGTSSILSPRKGAQKELFAAFMEDVTKKGLNKTMSSQISNIGKKIWAGTKEPLNVVVAENIEEGATDLATNALDENMLNIRRTAAQLADQTFTTFVQTTFQTLPLAIGVGIGGRNDMSGVRKQSIFEVGKQPDLFKSLTLEALNQQKITQGQYNDKVSQINQLQNIVAGLPTQDAQGKQLSYDEVAELAAQQFRIDTNEQKLKGKPLSGEVPIIEADSKEAIKRQGEILNPPISETVLYKGSEWTIKKDNGDTVDIVKDDGLSHITVKKSELDNLKTKEDEKIIFPVRNNDFAEKYFSKESPAGQESEFAKYQRLKDENEELANEMIANKKEEVIAATELSNKGIKNEEIIPVRESAVESVSPNEKQESDVGNGGNEKESVDVGTEERAGTKAEGSEDVIPGTKSEELKLTSKKRDVLDEVTDEKVGEKEYQDFSIDFNDGARAFGKIEDGVASIAGINAPKVDGDVVRGTKTYERVLDKLSQQGIKTISVKLQSNDSSKAIDKLIDKGVLTNPRDVIGSSGNERATTFDIGTKSEQQTPSTVKSENFSIDGNESFFHASSKERKGRLSESAARQFGKGVYFSTNKESAKQEFGEHVTEVKLNIKNPVYTGTKEWHDVEREAIKMADEEYGAKKGLKLDDGDTYHRYDPDNLSEINEIPAIHISNAAKKLGYDAIVDKGSHAYDNEVIVLDESKIAYPEDNKNETAKGEVSKPTEAKGTTVTETDQNKREPEEGQAETVKKEGGQNDSGSQAGQIPGEIREGQESVQAESEQGGSSEKIIPGRNVQTHEEEIDQDYTARENSIREYVTENEIELDEDEIDLAAGLIGEEDSVRDAVQFVVQDRVNNSVQPLYNYISEIKSEKIRNKEMTKLVDENFDQIVAQLVANKKIRKEC